jgi:hypothetical protein
VRPAEVASPLAAHKNSRKAQIHVGPLSNWNRQTAMLWEAIGPLPDSSERHEGGLLFGESDRKGRSRQYRASGSPIRDRFKSTGSGIQKEVL